MLARRGKVAINLESGVVVESAERYLIVTNTRGISRSIEFKDAAESELAFEKIMFMSEVVDLDILTASRKYGD